MRSYFNGSKTYILPASDNDRITCIRLAIPLTVYTDFWQNKKAMTESTYWQWRATKSSQFSERKNHTERNLHLNGFDLEGSLYPTWQMVVGAETESRMFIGFMNQGADCVVV